MNSLDNMTALEVSAAVTLSRGFAEERGIAMTLERLAVCLGISSKNIMAFAADEREKPEETEAVREVLLAALEEIAACHVEHGMTRGNNPTMDKLCLLQHFGYGENGTGGSPYPCVVFYGEDAIPE